MLDFNDLTLSIFQCFNVSMFQCFNVSIFQCRYAEMFTLPDGGIRIKPPHEYAEELMAFLRKTHASLASETEVLLSALITKFKPGPEEELLSAVLGK